MPQMSPHAHSSETQLHLAVHLVPMVDYDAAGHACSPWRPSVVADPEALCRVARLAQALERCLEEQNRPPDGRSYHVIGAKPWFSASGVDQRCRATASSDSNQHCPSRSEVGRDERWHGAAAAWSSSCIEQRRIGAAHRGSVRHQREQLQHLGAQRLEERSGGRSATAAEGAEPR